MATKKSSKPKRMLKREPKNLPEILLTAPEVKKTEHKIDFRALTIPETINAYAFVYEAFVSYYSEDYFGDDSEDDSELGEESVWQG